MLLFAVTSTLTRICVFGQLRWVKNIRRHFQLPSDMKVWIWWDLLSIPQHNRTLQRKAIASLCYYATLCSRFIPLVRDENEWRTRYGNDAPGSDTLPRGTLGVYLDRGWCRLEIVAALCPKRFKSSQKFRPGPVNTRFRFHHDPEASSCGPAISGEYMKDPRTGQYHDKADIKEITPILQRLAEEYTAYKESGSTAWAATLDVANRPAWLSEVLGDAEGSCDQERGQVRVRPAPVEVEIRQPSPF